MMQNLLKEVLGDMLVDVGAILILAMMALSLALVIRFIITIWRDEF